MIEVDKCCITHYPAKVLANEAKSIETIDENIHQLVKKMTEIMFENNGIGLAAPQAGIDLRIFIISLTAKPEDLKVYINPVLETKGEMVTNEEGCLSVPNIYTKIKRYKECTVTATDLDGNQFTDHADGLYARCLQHEYDHLNGMTIANKMGQTAKIRFRRQLKKLEQNCSD
jgi:peptide deformylase